MNKKLLPFLISSVVFLSVFNSCSKQEEDIVPITSNQTSTESNFKAATIILSEGFENASKSSYTAAAVTLTSGSWNLNDALIGNTSSDRKSGLNSARVRNTGKITMQYDLANGAGTVQVKHAKYGTDGSSTWELWKSTNSGTSWSKVGSTITSSTTTLAITSFTVKLTGTVRFEIRKISGGTNRINIDDISVTDNSTGTGGTVTPPAPVTGDNDNMLLGNPSNATSDLINTNNYLMVKPQYCLSYSNTKHTPNWTSWHLYSADIGSAARQDDFRSDATLPTAWYKVTASEFSGSGFDRGHMCPSADRTSTVANNSATFLMTNMIPQSPNNNQIPWANLENYTRSLVTAGNEVYIVSGPAGQGGTGSVGYATTVGNGVVVPAQTWKIIVVIPNGNGDLSRITASTRVISIIMANNQTVSSQAWGYYRVSVDAIETLTGYNFLSNVPLTIQNTLESKVDNL
ncbi:MAG: DNA/RNA non-specific endonuclease [Bacteroidales bacterium]|nr:DNA/RNA non-specific endonuclease [Bacteroidales bacterium]